MLALGVVVLMVAAGCGSTVQVGAGQQGGELGGEAVPGQVDDGLALGEDKGLNLPGTGASSPAGASPAGGGSGPAGTGAGQARTGSGQAATGGASQADAGAGGAQPGPGGETRPGGGAGPGSGAGAGAAGEHDGTKEVQIGLYYASDSNEYLQAVGAESTVPDIRDAAEVVVKDINARGGVAGRELVPVYHPIRSTSDDRQGQDQAACEDFTQDRPVTTVISPGYRSNVLADCLAKAGVPYLYTGLTIDDAASFDRRPFQSEPISINLDRLAGVQVDRLVAQDWLSHVPGSEEANLGQPVKLGVVAFDDPMFRGVFERVLAPGFEANGTPVEEAAFVRTDTAGLTNDINNAVLRFSQNGVTHVTFLTSGGLAPGLFVVRAHNQRYEPRYGFTSQDAMQIVWEDNIRPLLGDDAARQLRGALGVGWLPLGDVANGSDPGVAPPSYQRCLDTMAEGGVQPRDTNYNGFLAFVCDGFWFLDAAFEASGGAQLTASTFIAGHDRLGAAYEPATVPRTRVGPDRRDGVSAVRDFAFFDECKCFRYTSDSIEV